MSSLYQHTAANPFHISVGALVVNEEGNILVHKILKENVPPEQWKAFAYGVANKGEIYILMRESLEDGETLEEAVVRGVKEEFGIEGTVKRHLGSIQGKAIGGKSEFEKTTLYFEVRPSLIKERPSDDPESFSILEWHEPQFLIERMKEQSAGLSRQDLDESKIIEAYVKFS